MNAITIQLDQGIDETGAPFTFTWDLFPVVDSAETLHLDTNGLPKIGSSIGPGMILVGKIGKTQAYNPLLQPTSLEIHGLPPEALRAKYGHMWKNGSLYAGASTSGKVLDAHFEVAGDQRRAVIWIDHDEQSSQPEVSRGRVAPAR